MTIYRLLTPSQTPLDTHWHQRLLACMALPNNLYAYLMPEANHLASLRQDFENSGHTDISALWPPTRYREEFEVTKLKLSQLASDIAETETNEHIRSLYLDRLAELAANCDVWLAADRHDHDGFEAANVLLYGEPDKAIFAAECTWLRDFATRQAAHPEAQVSAAAKRVLDLIPNLGGEAKLLEPDEQAYHSLRTQHMQIGGYFDQLFADVAIPDQVITSVEGDILVQQILDTIGSPYTIADAIDGYWGVRHDTEKVIRPPGYELTPASFVGIVTHEIGSHLLERVNGFRGPLQLAATGLDHFEHGNEGRAYLREQLALGSMQAMQDHPSWEFSIARHLAISFAVGVSTKRHDFSEVYDIIYALDLLWALLRTPDTTLAARSARDSSWALATRIFKGTDGHHGAYRKDIVYIEGNLRCWQLAKHSPERIFLGDLGKFDIASQKHLDHLRALGVL